MAQSSPRQEMTVITKAKDLSKYIFIATEKSPKKFRFTLVSRMQNMALDVIECLYRANAVFVERGRDKEALMEQRKNFQLEAFTNLKLLDYLAMTSREQQCILPRQHENISKYIAECIQYLGAWVNSDEKRFAALRTKL